MTLPQQPKSMIVVGSGAIGVEFSYFYNCLGTKVTIVEFLPRIVPVEDEEISKELDKNFKKQGIEIMTSSEVTSVDTSGNGVKAKVKTPDGEKTLKRILLSAVGVSSNIEGIGLEELAIKTDKGKILVDKFYQTNVPGIYAIGDCVPGQALAHVASKKGSFVLKILASTKKNIITNLKYWIIIMFRVYVLLPGNRFSGLYRKTSREAGFEVKVGKFPLSASGKASAAGHYGGLYQGDL
jgi:dihydrolipoamide dehydrogenase